MSGMAAGMAEDVSTLVTIMGLVVEEGPGGIVELEVAVYRAKTQFLARLLGRVEELEAVGRLLIQMFLLPVEGELVQTERARQRDLLQPGPEVEEALGV